MSMITRLLSGIDRLSKILGAVTMVMTAILIVVMSYEMVVRRGFDSPTLWAFDVSYMLSGVIFVAAVPFALLHNEHVRIDFLSTRLPLRVQHSANLFFYAALFLPAIFILARVAVGEAWNAFVTGQTERVSPWAPLIWPYYSALAVGLVALVLQVLAEMVRHAMQIISPTAPVGAQAAPSAERPVVVAKAIGASMPVDISALAAEKT
jgi:TRAP-type mannitol/chloroaromatic compound transport system permease small subunit